MGFLNLTYVIVLIITLIYFYIMFLILIPVYPFK
jgi:hypothetical protein